MEFMAWKTVSRLDSFGTSMAGKDQGKLLSLIIPWTNFRNLRSHFIPQRVRGSPLGSPYMFRVAHQYYDLCESVPLNSLSFSSWKRWASFSSNDSLSCLSSWGWWSNFPCNSMLYTSFLFFLRGFSGRFISILLPALILFIPDSETSATPKIVALGMVSFRTKICAQRTRVTAWPSYNVTLGVSCILISSREITRAMRIPSMGIWPGSKQTSRGRLCSFSEINPTNTINQHLITTAKFSVAKTSQDLPCRFVTSWQGLAEPCSSMRRASRWQGMRPSLTFEDAESHVPRRLNSIRSGYLVGTG